MVKCCAYKCANSSKNKPPGVTFHNLPKNEERLKLWLKAIRRLDWQPTPYTRLCSKHFEEQYMDRTSKNSTRLRDDAIPTIFPGHPTYLQKAKTSRPPTKYISFNKPPETPSHSKQTSPDSPRRLAMKRKIDKLSSHCSSQRKKIKILLQTKNRNKKSMTSLVVNLKRKRLINEDFEILTSLGGISKDLSQRAALKIKGKSCTKYSAELRKFALTLNFFSPRAYSYVCQVFNTCLPHTRTLSKWYQCIDGSPGLTKEAIVTLKSRIAVSEQLLVCSLVIDEMSIRKFIEWNGSKYYDEVTQVLVVMLVCVNGTWKLPV